MKSRMSRDLLCTGLLILGVLVAVPAAASEPLEVIESETGFYYTIQKGDTLWGLSQRFSDSPWLWPELWEENNQISNPHWIFPGERIRLHRKSGAQTIAPSTPAPPAPVVTASVEPKPAKKIEAPHFIYPAMERVGFIRKPPVAPVGTLFEVRGQKTLISESDVVYINAAEGSDPSLLIPGSRHTVFRYLPPTKARDAIETIGTQHYILGVVEVTQKEPEMVIAKVLKSFRPMAVGDLLMPYRRLDTAIPLTPSTPGIDGRIITPEEHTKLTGEYMLAFIDKGRADKIEVGQQYSIYRQQKHRSDDTLFPPVDFGRLVVLHTEETTATVVITNSQDSISPGERFRTPID